MANVYRVTVSAPQPNVNLDFKTKREREDFLILMNNVTTSASFRLSDGKKEEISNGK